MRAGLAAAARGRLSGAAGAEMSVAIVWFRRDLRMHDHPALSTAAREYEVVVPVFVVDPKLIAGRYESPSRVRFMFDCLVDLDVALRQRGSELVLLRGTPERELPKLAREAGADAVLWSSDVSPYALARDRRVREALRDAGVNPRQQAGNYVTDIGRLRTGADRPYQVFSPFHRAWDAAPRREAHGAPRKLRPLPATLGGGRLPDALDRVAQSGRATAQPIVAAGETAGRKAFSRWLSAGIDAYAERHDALAREHGTAELSPYLRWGCLSPVELERRALRHGGAGAEAWVRQLCWRDFYAHVLLHWPQNVKFEFQASLRGLEWEQDAERLAAWREGMTGYPIVDAAMRQLSRTGWMHNRARLIVGSFLTKDLQLDWREGELWFARLLLDGEPAQNNGNWQWIASVGTDPAPVARRLYNPTSQANRHDPDGEYVRRWVPELRDVPLSKLHEPWRMSASEQRQAGCVIGRDYPAPIVEHAHERARALERYAQARAPN